MEDADGRGLRALRRTYGREDTMHGLLGAWSRNNHQRSSATIRVRPESHKSVAINEDQSTFRETSRGEHA
jgi:hypothetical protein